jgi:hypothetical protein
MKAQNYKLYARNGKYIRTATKVVFDDGREIKFIDKMNGKEAIKNALKTLTPTALVARTRHIKSPNENPDLLCLSPSL